MLLHLRILNLYIPLLLCTITSISVRTDVTRQHHRCLRDFQFKPFLENGIRVPPHYLRTALIRDQLFQFTRVTATNPHWGITLPPPSLDVLDTINISIPNDSFYLFLLVNRYSYATSHTRFTSNADFFSPCVSNQYPVTHYKYILTFLTLSLVQDHSPKSPLACANFGPCGL